MKKFLFLAIGVALFSCNNDTEKQAETAPKNTDLIQQNLKGKVLQIDEAITMIDSTGASKLDSLTSTSLYDAKGYQTEYYAKNASGVKETEQIMKHNAAGEFTEVIYKKNGKQSARLETEIKDGKYITGKHYDSTGKQDSYYADLKTSENGIVYSGKELTMSGKVKSTFDMKYDGPNFVGGTSTDSTGAVVYTGTVKLNDKKDAAEESETTTEKGVTKTEVTTYKYVLDDKGNWTQRTTYNDKGKATKIVNRKFTYYKD